MYSPREPKSDLTGGLVVLHGGGFMAGGASKIRVSNVSSSIFSEFCLFSRSYDNSNITFTKVVYEKFYFLSIN